jgi:hypothetical protein
MQIVTATVLDNPKIVTTRYGEKTVTLVRLSDGSSEKLWTPADQARFNYLKAAKCGDRIQIGVESTGRLKALDQTISIDPTVAQPQPRPIGFQQPVAPPAERDNSSKIDSLCNAYSDIFERLQKRLGNQLQPSELTAATSTILIQYCRQNAL